ncbi:hypothetical protein [Microcystis wesenbergii]|uniref:Uncharacterized protein n=1 Tax=Microcystis wesenbergii NRERC-220 TaxID=3068991 RepID=A0ABU3HRM4_9CHRO|nr:hypothetical protein [Microcystis wesenbergii]MDT3677200.1 hypothetical protein [Microcystis wesenbergii NRERC-220]
MSKVISFSISDRYLDKLRTLYPALTDNLAAKQFLTDRLDSSLGSGLDASLDDGLDDRVKTLIESWVDGLLEVRLDATVGKSLTSLSERLTRLEARLDTNLDGSLDDMEPLLKLQRESSIATSPIPTEEPSPLPPSPSLPPDELGEGGNANTPDSPPSPLDQPAIETLTREVSPSPPSPVKEAIETDDREWLTLQQIADKKIKGLPGTYQGLRPYAEKWESRKNPQKKGEQYKIPKEYL